MAEYLQYVAGLRREIASFYTTTGLIAPPATSFSPCGEHPNHFIPPEALQNHLVSQLQVYCPDTNDKLIA